MTKLREGKYTVITMDEALYNKAKMLQWEDGRIQERGDHARRFPYTDDILESHWKVPDILGHLRHVGRKRDFWRNHS